MVLAAGFGTRLGDLTRETPKPMLDVNGRPLLEYIVGNLRRHGFCDIVLNVHFEPEAIRSHFGDGSRFGVRLTYSYEPELLGTAGGLKNVESFFNGEDDILVQYGDVVTDVSFADMLRFHRSHAALATLLVHERHASNSVVVLDPDNRIVRFLERPPEEAREGITSRYVHSGVGIARRTLLDHIERGRVADLPRDVYVPLIESGQSLYGFPLKGYRCAVDSPARLNDLRAAAGSGTVDIALDPNG